MHLAHRESVVEMEQEGPSLLPDCPFPQPGSLHLQEPNERTLRIMQDPTQKLVMVFLKKYHPREGRLEVILVPVTRIVL